jgi:hypothetical protein
MMAYSAALTLVEPWRSVAGSNDSTWWRLLDLGIGGDPAIGMMTADALKDLPARPRFGPPHDGRSRSDPAEARS